ncbi:MAG TPA: ABC transporter permease subunit [Dehalococcoidia bacterium]|nr:ABC transporter permease subunit [Dehalococcoidia bacterium]
MTSEPAPRGTIYDIGYQPYDGPRLGRRFAIWSLYLLSLRNAFGLGRGRLPKVLAFGLVLLAFIPAVVQVVLAAVVPIDEFEFVQPHEYYGFIQVIIILFVAGLSSDLIGNDRRQGTLSLYFSRPIQRGDYAAAKLAALATALLAVTVLPQAVMFGGNWLGSSDAIDWAKANGDDFAPIIGSGLLVCVMFASIGIACAAYAERRSFALITVLIVFVVPFVVAQIVVDVTDGEAARFIVLFSPAHVMRGFTLFLFDAFPVIEFGSSDGGADNVLASVDLPGGVYLIIAFLYTGITSLLAFTRFRSPA